MKLEFGIGLYRLRSVYNGINPAMTHCSKEESFYFAGSDAGKLSSLLCMGCADFMQWLIENGAQHFGVDIRDCSKEDGKGLFAITDFRENETIICIPVEIIITAGLVAEIPDYCDVFKRHRLKPFEALVYFFLLEKDRDSKWAPYLKMLPKSFSTPANLHPSLEPEDFPFCLRRQWLVGTTDELIQHIYFHSQFVTILADTIIWDKFLWAWHIVNTRCIYRDNKRHPLIDNVEGDSLAVVPLIDMLNHSNDNQCFGSLPTDLLSALPDLIFEVISFLRHEIRNSSNILFKEHWAKVIYKETEAVTDNDVLVIVRLLRDEMIRNGKRSAQETRWLWNEQATLLHILLDID
ncbi:unnamed protein product [Acanthocheilonema viteae]|uniref:Uncharacterized protein n=1 Tax=Acanthocheilonema viteae TaxID=6277 RepID=A0A498SFE3_ACAVI|nr:unnamed protein product [Acanthocheilonema viteae]